MIFNSFTFILFFTAYWIAQRLYSQGGKIKLTLIASYFFYGWWDPRFLTLILISTGIDFLCGLKIESAKNQSHRRRYLILSIVTNLGILGFFKYFNFFTESTVQLANSIGLELSAVTLDLVLPVGISFYTFQSMSYTIDIYRGSQQAEKDWLAFSTYVAFFPQLVAGPIERAGHLLPQIKNLGSPSAQQIQEGIWLVLWGWFLKTVVADNLAFIVNYTFSIGAQPGGGFYVALAVLAFYFQIYGDFCGYSNIARGISKFIGVDLCKNFCRPFFAVNPADFWRRWHISLSSWLRDYLYISLGGNRRGNLRTYTNLMITMLLGGLWHGASVLFVAWGFYQGLLLVIHRFYTGLNLKLRFPRAVSQFLMFLAAMYGWLIFRAESWSQLKSMTSVLLSSWDLPTLSLTAGFPQYLEGVYIFWIITFGGIVWAIDWIEEKNNQEIIWNFQNTNRDWSLLIAITLAMAFFNAPSFEFIYFQF